MAEESFPFQEIATGDRTVSAAMFAKHLGMTRTRGVIKNLDGQLAVAQSSPAAMSVDLASGAALVGLTELRAYRNTLARTLAIAAADPSNPRNDLLVLELDTATSPDTRRVTALIVQGAPAASPSDPTLTQTEAKYQLAVARVRVNAGATSITNTNLTDLRSYSKPQNLVAQRSLVLAAPAFTPDQAAAGPAAATVNGANFDYPVLDFDQSTVERAFTSVVLPAEYGGGNLTAEFWWTAAGGSGAVKWDLDSRSPGDDDVWDAALTADVATVTDALLATGDLHKAVATWSANLPTAGRLLQLKVERDASAGGDTLNADARLIALRLTFETNEV